MTDPERDAATSRAYADLKRACSNTAILSASLDAYARDLQAAAKLVSGFSSDPHIDVSRPFPESIKRDLFRLPEPAKMAALIDELLDETRLVERLTNLVDQF